MQRRVQLDISLVCVGILLTFMPSNAKSDEVLSPAAQRGFVILKTDCSRCHAIGKIGESPLKIAPPFTSTIPLKTSKNRLRRGLSLAIRQCPSSGSIRVRSAISSRT
jgi:hypothetical protein